MDIRFENRYTANDAMLREYVNKVASRSISMMLGKQNGILLSKTGFTVGSFEDFQPFIREKTGKKG